MKKDTKNFYIALCIAFILFNVIAFVVPTVKNVTFWIAYAFTVVAFALQIRTWNAILKTNNTLKSKFLEIPIVYVSIVYLVLQLIAFVVFMVFAIIIPSWVSAIVCAFILGISAICLIIADVAIDEINRVEEKVNKKVFYIRELQMDVEMLAEQEKNKEIKVALKELAEKIRYSDPMSNNALTDLEAKICKKVTDLKTTDHKLEIITELDLLLTERNKKAKILK